MAKHPAFQVGPLKETEVEEAGRISRLAFGTFLGLPNPLEFMGDRDLFTPRWHARNTKLLAARENGRLIGSNVVTRWGSFGFFGPLTVLPEYWDRGVAHELLKSTIKVFDAWGVRHRGLFTFPHSAKHVGLYQKHGFWPGYLTPVMNYTPKLNAATAGKGVDTAGLLSAITRGKCEEAIGACTRLTNRIEKGLDLAGEIRSLLTQKVGDVVLLERRGVLDGFAVCMHGAGSEGGSKTCYVKFAAARGGSGAGERFDGLLDAIDWFAVSRGADVEAGVNFAREDAFRRMRAHGYRTMMQGVAMQSPHAEGFNRAEAYVMDDWR